MKLNTPIENVQRIGPTYAKRLQKLGIKEVKDLLFHFPARYEDYSQTVPIKNIKKGAAVTVEGKIVSVRERPTSRRNLKIIEAVLEDKTGAVKAVWFNQRHIKTALDTSSPVLLAGKASLGKDGLYLNNPIYEIKPMDRAPVHTGRLIGIYPETSGVSSRWLRHIILRLLPLAKDAEEILPEKLRTAEKLPNIQTALQQIHFPKNQAESDAAKNRFAFQDLFLIQLAAIKTKKEIQKSSSPKIKTNVAMTKKFVASLPYTLTDSQKKAAWQILKDMERDFPMNRLLEGDVGSGKTIVALMAAVNAVNAGWQAAFMAPTEILAEQHHATITSLLGKPKLQIPNSKQKLNYKFQIPKIALLTSSGGKLNGVKISKPELKKKIATGEVDIIIGTHAVIQKDVKFKNLGLVVLDEQHRFGVVQRAALVKKTKQVPHLLSMTATPIPRSLALTIYGDLDISLLTEMPAGRKKIITKVMPPGKRKEAYSFIKKELDAGRQAFVIFPLVEDSPALELRSAKAEYEKLKEGPFKNYQAGLLHGRMRGKEKEEIMTKMKEGKIQILVATSVVEVGIDIPNATIMMVDGADRFGLAQLHQFRGRVGRGEHQSYAFLLTDSSSASVLSRLNALQKASSGFELAEYDLKFRGAGDMYGVRQSGMPDIAMQSLSNIELVEKTRKAANDILDEDLSLAKWPALKEEAEKLQKTMHFE